MFYKAMLKKRKNKKAFTLIELIVVIAIIGVLVAILVPVMGNFVSSAQNATAKANARTIYGIAQAQAQFIVSTGGSVAASTWDSTAAAVSGDFLSQVKPMFTSGGASGGYYKIITTAGNIVSSVTYYVNSSASATYP